MCFSFFCTFLVLSWASAQASSSLSSGWVEAGIDLDSVEARYLSFDWNEQKELAPTKCNSSKQVLLACIHAVNSMLSHESLNALLLPVDAEIGGKSAEELKRFSNFKLVSVKRDPKNQRRALQIWSDYFFPQNFQKSVLDARNHPPFREVFNWVRVQQSDSTVRLDLAKQAINGYLQLLFRDHARIQPWPEIVQLMQRPRESLVGYGFAFKMRERRPVVFKVLPSSPAARSGLQINDVLLEANNWSLESRTKEEIDVFFRSLGSDSKVSLKVERGSESLAGLIELKKEALEFDNVVGEVLSQGTRKIGLITVSSFYRENVCPDVKAQIAELKNVVEGWIIDIRNNGGGLVDQAVCVADLFLQKGLLVTKTKPVVSAEKPKEYFSIRNPETDLPAVVLVDEATGSASEFFAGALADHQRAILVGNRTAGKGTIQTSFQSPFASFLSEPENKRVPFWDAKGMVLFVTTSQFYQPLGASNQLNGILPHLKAFRSPHYSNEGEVLREADRAINPVRTERKPQKRDLSLDFKKCLKKGLSHLEFGDDRVDHSDDFQVLRGKDALLCQLQELKGRSSSL